MTSNRRLDLSPEAEADLRELLQYSGETWGANRQRAYGDRLLAVMDELTVYPNLGRARDDVSPGLRGFPVREHVIYYRTGDDAVVISRILHRRIDAAGHFDADR